MKTFITVFLTVFGSLMLVIGMSIWITMLIYAGHAAWAIVLFCATVATLLATIISYMES